MNNLKFVEVVAKIQRMTLKDDVLIVQVPSKVFNKEVGEMIGDVLKGVGIDMKRVAIFPDEFKFSILRKVARGKRK